MLDCCPRECFIVTLCCPSSSPFILRSLLAVHQWHNLPRIRAFVGLSMNVSACLKEHQNTSLESSMNGHMQWCPASIIIGIKIQISLALGAVPQELLEYPKTPVQDCEVQCRATITIENAQARAVGEEQADY